MQFDPYLIAVGFVVLFLTIGLSMVFTDIWKGVLRRIRERFVSGIQIEVELAVHEFDRGGLFSHYIGLNISNTSKRNMRIDNIKILDKRKRELKSDTSSGTPLDIGPDNDGNWFCFCQRKPTRETDIVRLKMGIERLGKRTIWKSFESRFVSDREFPSRRLIF